jgi:hypothetical protein
MTLIAAIGVRNERWEGILFYHAPSFSDADYVDEINGDKWWWILQMIIRD